MNENPNSESGALVASKSQAEIEVEKAISDSTFCNSQYQLIQEIQKRIKDCEEVFESCRQCKISRPCFEHSDNHTELFFKLPNELKEAEKGFFSQFNFHKNRQAKAGNEIQIDDKEVLEVLRKGENWDMMDKHTDIAIERVKRQLEELDKEIDRCNLCEIHGGCCLEHGHEMKELKTELAELQEKDLMLN